MEFFNRYKNDFYRAIQRVALYVQANQIRYEDIPKIRNDVFLTLTQDLVLSFEKNDNLKPEVLYGVQRLYKDYEEQRVSSFALAHVQPMKWEQQFLSAMLHSKIGEFFVEDAVKEKLDAVLPEPEPADSFIEEDVSWEIPLQEHRDNILTIMQAIDANVWIEDSEDNLFLPYKIRYSMRWKTFELLAETEARTVILRNLNDFSALKLTRYVGTNRKPLETLAKALLAEETVILQVNHHRPDILDRCFALLRQHERFGYLLNKTGEGPDIYQFEIRYLKQEEDQLIQDILSLNDAVVVTSPERIRNLVIEEWKRVASYYG